MHDGDPAPRNEAVRAHRLALPHLFRLFFISAGKKQGTDPKQIDDDFCGLVLNQPLGGLRVIEGTALYDERTDGMASVAAYTYGDHTVVFVGTRTGHLKKAVKIAEGAVTMAKALEIDFESPSLYKWVSSGEKPRLNLWNKVKIFRIDGTGIGICISISVYQKKYPYLYSASPSSGASLVVFSAWFSEDVVNGLKDCGIRIGEKQGQGVKEDFSDGLSEPGTWN
ncbi:Plexin A3 [Bagarius yarrelli]|uniref:Plexin A3 n=1 Tax=Bagarius yarrelli TaxID=175774 RepID=A0A556VAT0_BAGYA|nr:Plexin A3 [Bagarius yarrelli]